MGSKQVGLLLTVVMLILAFDSGNFNIQELSIRSNAITSVEDSEAILHRDSRSVHRSRRSVLNSTEIQEALVTHNRLRRLEGSSNMELMIWDNDLANTAERSAQSCIFDHSNFGQNLYSSTNPEPINLTAAIEDWYNEKPYYAEYYNTGICKAPSGQCLHYTQVVWATSRKLGCAYTRCATLSQSSFTNALLLVCNYDPVGNVGKEKPYKAGSGCSQCSTGSWWCNEGLCDQSCTTSGSTCGCAPVCLNFASVNIATCSCSCSPGWYGSDCNVECKNYDSKCEPQPPTYWPPEYCTRSDYGPTVREKCPKMCKLCKGVGDNNYSTSTKPSLLNMLSVWLSWLLIYCIWSI